MSDADYDNANLYAAVNREKRRKRPEPDRAVIAAAERQMERRLLEQRGKTKEPTPASINPYIAISRESGVGGSQIARLAGQALGWDVLDHELLECMAERYHTSPAMLELVDEKTTSWITEVFGNLIRPHSVSQTQYVFRLSRMIIMAAHTGKNIYVGRGAQFLLPREHGLAVRLIAGHKYRVQQIMERRRLLFEDARDYVAKTDAGRQALAKQYFHHDVTDPHLFDLVINVDKFGPQLAARQIADAAASCLHQKLSS